MDDTRERVGDGRVLLAGMHRVSAIFLLLPARKLVVLFHPPISFCRRAFVRLGPTFAFWPAGRTLEGPGTPVSPFSCPSHRTLKKGKATSSCSCVSLAGTGGGLCMHLDWPIGCLCFR